MRIIGMEISDLINATSTEDFPIWTSTVMFAITARSGSTAICNALSDAGAAREIGEIFNPRGPYNLYYRSVGGGDNVIQYLNRFYEQNHLLYKLIFKTDLDDLKLVISTHKIKNLFPDLKVISLDRNDKVEQAVSLFRAKLTSIWHRDISEKEQNSPPPKITEYDFDGIDIEYRRLKKSSANWETFYDRYNIEPMRIEYDDFLQRPQNVLVKLAEFIGDMEVDQEFIIRQTKIADDLSREWSYMFREELENRQIHQE